MLLISADLKPLPIVPYDQRINVPQLKEAVMQVKSNPTIADLNVAETGPSLFFSFLPQKIP